MTTTQSLLSPLYTRVLEASLECFSSFHRDRELDKWSKQLLNNNAEATSLKSLDFLLSQVSSMRELINKHYQFMHRMLSPIALRNFIQSNNTNQSNNTQNGRDFVSEMLIVSTEEFNKWRELEAVYIILEYGYMKRAVNDALCESALLELEDFVYVPQALEDVFFIFHRAAERALSTGSEHCVFAIGNKIVEMLRTQGSLNNTSDFELSEEELLYKWISSRITFKNSIRNNSISTAAIEKNLVKSAFSTKQLKSKSNINSNNNQQAGTIASSKGDNGVYKSELGTEFSAAVEIANGVGGLITQGSPC